MSSSVRFYDPTTGNFTSRDPAVGLTRLPYGYTYGDPLNHVDRNGLWPWDGICVAIANPDCDNSGTQQWAGNVFAGAGNALTFGQGVDVTAKLTGQGDDFTARHGDSDSWAYRGGAIGGFILGAVVVGGGAAGGRSAAGAEASETCAFMEGAEFSSTRASVSGDKIGQMADRMRAGWQADAIKVTEEGAIVDGHHRYIASVLSNTPIGHTVVPWPSPLSTFPWSSVLIW